MLVAVRRLAILLGKRDFRGNLCFRNYFGFERHQPSQCQGGCHAGQSIHPEKPFPAKSDQHAPQGRRKRPTQVHGHSVQGNRAGTGFWLAVLGHSHGIGRSKHLRAETHGKNGDAHHPDVAHEHHEQEHHATEQQTPKLHGTIAQLVGQFTTRKCSAQRTHSETGQYIPGFFQWETQFLGHVECQKGDDKGAAAVYQTHNRDVPDDARDASVRIEPMGVEFL